MFLDSFQKHTFYGICSDNVLTVKWNKSVEFLEGLEQVLMDNGKNVQVRAEVTKNHLK